MTSQQQDPGAAAAAQRLMHPESVHAPAWKSRHVGLKLARFEDGWIATANLYRHQYNPTGLESPADAMRMYQCAWEYQSPLNDEDVVELMWRSCHVFAAQAIGCEPPTHCNVGRVRKPTEPIWVGGHASLVPGANVSHLDAWITGKGHTSAKPNEKRVNKETLERMIPALPAALLSTLGYLIEQHQQ